MPILSQINPLHRHPSYLLIRFNIICTSRRISSKWSIFFKGLPTKTLCATLLSTTRATCPAHPTLRDLITRKKFTYYDTPRCAITERQHHIHSLSGAVATCFGLINPSTGTYKTNTSITYDVMAYQYWVLPFSVMTTFLSLRHGAS